MKDLPAFALHGVRATRLAVSRQEVSLCLDSFPAQSLIKSPLITIIVADKTLNDLPTQEQLL